MTCRERILSNDYADLVVNFVLPEDYDYDMPEDTAAMSYMKICSCTLSTEVFCRRFAMRSNPMLLYQSAMA